MGKKKWLLVLLTLICLCLACGVAQAEECSHAYRWDWKYNEMGHWQICSNCGEEVKWTRGAHCAYCDKPDVCAVCDAPYTGSNLQHRKTTKEHDENRHWDVCESCGSTVGRPDRHYAYCDKPGVCYYCDAPYTGSNIWHRETIEKFDENKHWSVCTTCEKITFGPYEHYAYCDVPDVCDYCGAPYTGNDIRHWESTIEHDENGHWPACTYCGAMLWSYPETHYAYCDTPDVCDYCGASYTGNELQHREFIVEHDENTHWEICNYCGETCLGPEKHYDVWDRPNICYVCGAPIPGQTATPTASPTPTPTATPTASPTPTPTATPVPTATEVPVPKATWDAESGKLVTANYPTYTGFVDFEGGKFYMKNGQQATDCNGPVLIDGILFAFDHGRVQMENMLMAFEGELFAFKDGTLRTELTGLAEYDGEKFVFDHGKLQRSANGPYLDPIAGKWVYVIGGQFYPTTGLVSYEGGIFYCINGILATDYVGIVYDFNGTGFYIVGGQHYKITDLVSCNGEVLYVVDGKFASWYTGVVKDYKGDEVNVVNGKVVTTPTASPTPTLTTSPAPMPATPSDLTEAPAAPTASPAPQPTTPSEVTEAPETPTASPAPQPTTPSEVTEAPEEPTASPAPQPTMSGDTTPAPKPVWNEETGKLVTPDDPTYTGFANFEGGQFYIENGQQKTDYVGPVQIDGTFYAFDRGRLQTENMMMSFEGGLFAFNGGKLRTDLIGLAAYDGARFVFDHGQYQHDACGPYFDPISDAWVYVNYGQYYPITDLATYDGEVFYFINGVLASDYTGVVYDFNGTGLYIASGQHYKITDLVTCSNGEILYFVDGRYASWYTGAVKDFMGTELHVVNGKVVQ